MDEQAQRTALLAALTTEHFVLQSATSTTYTEASAGRSGRLFALTDVLEPRQRWGIGARGRRRPKGYGGARPSPKNGIRLLGEVNKSANRPCCRQVVRQLARQHRGRRLS